MKNKFDLNSEYIIVYSMQRALPLNLLKTITHSFTLMHLADAFIQSDLQCIQAIHFLYVSHSSRSYKISFGPMNVTTQ